MKKVIKIRKVIPRKGKKQTFACRIYRTSNIDLISAGNEVYALNVATLSELLEVAQVKERVHEDANVPGIILVCLDDDERAQVVSYINFQEK